MKTLRPYQVAAIEATRRQLQQYSSTTVVLPTGLGKTLFASKLISDWEHGNCLFLAHTQELIAQAAERLEGELGYRPGVEMNVQAVEVDTIWQGGMTVVGSVQTMYGDRRLAKYSRHPFGLIVVDECVTGDTIIDTDAGKMRIDALPASTASTVMTYDGDAVCYRPITAFMPNGVRPVLRIETASGRVIRCTGNHPLYTARGWVNASAVRKSDSLLRAHVGAASLRASTSEVPTSFSPRSHPRGEPYSAPSSSTSPRVCSTSFDPVVSVRSDGVEPVYDISVEGTHCFFGNGVLVHNCHHATSATYKKVINHFQQLNPNLKVVGITATPNRSDGTALGLMFESVAYQMSINDAVSQGWLVPVNQEYVVVDTLEFDGIKTKKNEFGEADFSASQLEEVLTQEEMLHKMAVPTLEKVGDRPTLIFTATVRHAHELAAVLNRYRDGSAAAVDGGTPKEQRKEIIRDFSAGKKQFLCNCAVLTEGFDAPACAAIVMARPTKSLSLYTQMLGRGLRPLPGVVDGIADAQERQLSILTSNKPSCLVLDFVGNSNHKLASSYDVLGGKYDVETRELAKREAQKERKDVAEVMEQAAALLAIERQWKEREHIRAREVRYGSYNVNPFDQDAPEIVGSDYTGPKRGTATDSQVRLLVNLGVHQKAAESYSKRQAGVVIDNLGSTRCTLKQAKTLAKHGVNPNGIGMSRASRIIDAIAANGWRRPEELPT